MSLDEGDQLPGEVFHSIRRGGVRSPYMQTGRPRRNAASGRHVISAP
jgi:hypothetical protein